MENFRKFRDRIVKPRDRGETSQAQAVGGGGVTSQSAETFVREAVQHLGPTIPLNLRLQYATQSGFLMFLKKTKLDDPREVWSTVQDLVNPQTPPEGRQIGYQFMAALIQGQGQDLGLLRSVFFHVVRDSNKAKDFIWALDTLNLLTHSGRDLHGFEPELGPLLLSWSENPDPKFLLELLVFFVDLIKYSGSSIPEPTLVKLIATVCGICNRPGRDDAITTSCLAFFDVVVRYGSLPTPSVSLYTCTLCRTVNVNQFCQPSWGIMRNLLKSHRGYQTMMTLCAVLDSSRGVTATEGTVSLIRGALFFMGMACWGSNRITSVQFSFAAILPSFLNAMACNSETISYEVLLSVRRLVKKFGPQLWIEWTVLFRILTICVSYLQRDPNSNLSRIMHETLDDLENLEASGRFRGEPTQLAQLMLDCKPFRPEASVLRLIRSQRRSLHPAGEKWREKVTAFLQTFFVRERHTDVRLEALSHIRELVRMCKYYREAELMDLILGHLGNVAADRDRKVVLSGMELIIECVRSGQSHFAQFLPALVSALSPQNRDATDESDLLVVSGLISIFTTKFASLVAMPPPIQELLSVFTLLLGQLDSSCLAVREVLVDALSDLSCTRHYQAVLGKHMNPFLIIAPKGYDEYVRAAESGGPLQTTQSMSALVSSPTTQGGTGTRSPGASPRIQHHGRTTPPHSSASGSATRKQSRSNTRQRSREPRQLLAVSPRRMFNARTPPGSPPNKDQHHGHERTLSNASHTPGQTFEPASIETGFHAPSATSVESSPNSTDSKSLNRSFDKASMQELRADQDDNGSTGSFATGDTGSAAGTVQDSEGSDDGSIKRAASEPDIAGKTGHGKPRSSTFTSGLARQLAKSPVPKSSMGSASAVSGTSSGAGSDSGGSGVNDRDRERGEVSVKPVARPPPAATEPPPKLLPPGLETALIAEELKSMCGLLPMHFAIEKFVSRLSMEEDPGVFTKMMALLEKLADNVYVMRGVAFDKVVIELCDIIDKGTIGLKAASSGSGSSAPNPVDVVGHLRAGYHFLMKLIGYRRLMTSASQTRLVCTFIRGLSRSSGQTGEFPQKPVLVVCLGALSRLLAELPEIVAKYMPEILDILMNVDPKLGGSVIITILNLLHDIANTGGFFAQLSDDDFVAVINILLPFVNPDKTIPQFSNLNFQLLTAWYLSSPLPLRPRLAKPIIQTLHRHAQSMEDSKSPETLAGGLIELILRGAYSDIQLTTAVYESENKVFSGGISRTWIHDQVVTTVRLGTHGWIERIDRGITGTVVQYISIENDPRHDPDHSVGWALGLRPPEVPRSFSIDDMPDSVRTALARQLSDVQGSQEDDEIIVGAERVDDTADIGADKPVDNAPPSKKVGDSVAASPSSAASPKAKKRMNLEVTVETVPVAEETTAGGKDKSSRPIDVVRQAPPASPRDFVATDCESGRNRQLFPPESPDWHIPVSKKRRASGLSEQPSTAEFTDDTRSSTHGPESSDTLAVPKSKQASASSKKGKKKGTTPSAPKDTPSDAQRGAVTSDKDSDGDSPDAHPSAPVPVPGTTRPPRSGGAPSSSQAAAGSSGGARDYADSPSPQGAVSTSHPKHSSSLARGDTGSATVAAASPSADHTLMTRTVKSAAQAPAMSSSGGSGGGTGRAHRRSSSCGDNIGNLPAGRESFESSASMTTPPYSPNKPIAKTRHRRRRSLGDLTGNDNALINAAVARLTSKEPSSQKKLSPGTLFPDRTQGTPPTDNDHPSFNPKSSQPSAQSSVTAGISSRGEGGKMMMDDKDAPLRGTEPTRKVTRHLDPSIEVLPALRLKFQSKQPILIPNGDSLERALKVLDRTPCVHTCKVGVIYVGENQNGDEQAILANSQGSPKYSRFLSHLGSFQKLSEIPPGVYTGGLDRSDEHLDGEYALLWNDTITQCVFHVTTHMPTIPSDPRSIAKKRHIGNDYVCIIFTDSEEDYSLDTIPGEFNFVHIVIHPLTSGASAGYRVTVKSKPGLPAFGPLLGTTVVTGRALAPLVRQTALHAYISCLHHIKRDSPGTFAFSNWDERRQQIERIRERCDPRAQQPDELIEYLSGFRGTLHPQPSYSGQGGEK